MIKIEKNIEVESNKKYITSENGEFNDNDFVKCKLKTESLDNTVMFLASQIKNINNESSN
jgi:hypothetical protein